MTSEANGQAGIIRTERWLTIAGTRITLYDVMDLTVPQGYLPSQVKRLFGQCSKNRKLGHKLYEH